MFSIWILHPKTFISSKGDIVAMPTQLIEMEIMISIHVTENSATRENRYVRSK